MAQELACIILVALLTGAAFGQGTDTPPAFEAADVHVSAPSTNPFMRGEILRGNRYELRNATMVDLIRTAYGVDGETVVGGPSWLESDRYDVIAKAPPASSPEILKTMLQSLLADRFRLVIHNDKKPLPVYSLTLGKRKLQLKETDGAGEIGCKGQPQTRAPGVVPIQIISCHNLTMAAFATRVRQMANGYLDRPVVDMTGLKGSWDFDIKWTARGLLSAAGAAGVTIFDAVDKQLGLKLELQTVPTPVIVVDHVNRKPTDNLPGLEKSLPGSVAPTEFEVAVIKPSLPGSNARMMRIQPSGRVDFEGITLKLLITFAWDISNGDSLVGEPKWLDSDRFDLVAEASSSGPPLASPVDIDSLRLMMRALLADRFKLATHNETQPVYVYALVAPKGKTKLKKADESERATCKPSPGAIAGNPALTIAYTCQNTTMEQLAARMRMMAPGYIDHPVIDSTGLEGGWDFVLSWTGRGAFPNVGGRGGDAGQLAGGVATATDPNGGLTFFEAVERELGLKLESQKHPMPVLVIDHVEQKPTDN
jgi:uncharacterized protein (TIGR03435 family)